MENQQIKSTHNRKKLEYEGFLYVFHKLNVDDTVKFWRCEFHHTMDINCKGRVHSTLDDEVIKTVGEHTCRQSAVNVVVKKTITGLKRRAAETMETPAAIRTHVLQNVQTPVLCDIPTKNATKKV